MSFPKLFGGKAVVNTTRITVFSRTIPDFGLVLRAKQMLPKLLLTCNCYVTDYTVEIVRLPTRIFFNIIAREDQR